MFCSNCGKEISDNQRFCAFCGTKNTVEEDIVSMKQNFVINNSENIQYVSGAFNRDVLINYLDNLKVLESAKNKMETDYNNIKNTINRLSNKRYLAMPKSGKITVFNMVLLITGIVFLCITFLTGLLPFIILGAAYLIFPIIKIALDLKEYKRINEGKKFQKTEMENDQKELEKLKKQIPVVYKDLQKADNLLKEAYSINIIPGKYRNIYCIYFLYDYLSTSMVDLKEALFSCDLDEISKKFDVVVKQQQDIVMEIAYNNALNQEIIRQNQNIIERAIAIEKNTALAAQYQKITSLNTQRAADIQSYSFFKNGL